MKQWNSELSIRQCTCYRQNNGNAKQYRNKTVCIGCTERTLVVNIFRYTFDCLRCVVPVSVQYRLCLVTVRMKVLQNGRLLRLLVRV
jgi:hypothetical protein